MEPHKHCQMCGGPIPIDEVICSDKCREEFQVLMKKRKNRLYLIYALLAVFLVLLFYQQIGG